MFGNSEMRFACDKPIMESNIGHNYRSFDMDPKVYQDLEHFTGEKSSTSEIEAFEVYQIIFDKGY